MSSTLELVIDPNNYQNLPEHKLLSRNPAGILGHEYLRIQVEDTHTASALAARPFSFSIDTSSISLKSGPITYETSPELHHDHRVLQYVIEKHLVKIIEAWMDNKLMRKSQDSIIVRFSNHLDVYPIYSGEYIYTTENSRFWFDFNPQDFLGYGLVTADPLFSGLDLLSENMPGIEIKQGMAVYDLEILSSVSPLEIERRLNSIRSRIFNAHLIPSFTLPYNELYDEIARYWPIDREWNGETTYTSDLGMSYTWLSNWLIESAIAIAGNSVPTIIVSGPWVGLGLDLDKIDRLARQRFYSLFEGNPFLYYVRELLNVLPSGQISVPAFTYEDLANFVLNFPIELVEQAQEPKEPPEPTIPEIKEGELIYESGTWSVLFDHGESRILAYAPEDFRSEIESMWKSGQFMRLWGLYLYHQKSAVSLVSTKTPAIFGLTDK